MHGDANMDRRFLLTYACIVGAQVIFDVLIGLLGWKHLVSTVLVWFGWALVLAVGVTAGFAKFSVTQSALLALPLTAVGFIHGLLVFRFGWGDTPDNWVASEPDRAFQGFMIASAFFTFIYMVIAAVGAVLARLYVRTRGVRGASSERR
jgi:hypothetical protein